MFNEQLFGMETLEGIQFSSSTGEWRMSVLAISITTPALGHVPKYQ